MSRNFHVPRRPASGEQPLTASHHDADTRVVLEFLAENPSAFEPRGMIAQTLVDALTLIVWALLGAVALMVIGAPFMFLWVLFFFH